MPDAATAANAHQTAKPKALPKPNGEFYQTFQLRHAREQEKVRPVREFIEAAVAPVVNKYWAEDAFPFAAFGNCLLAILGYERYGCADRSNLLAPHVAMEMARVDCSFATFFGVHSGLAIGSICGTEKQKQERLPSKRQARLRWLRIPLSQ